MLLTERDRLKAYFTAADSMTVLGIQDTTDLDFTGNQVADKLGSLNYANRKGYYAHNHLLCDQNGVSIGLFNQFLWNRDPNYFGQNRTLWSIVDKESIRWLTDFEQFQSFFAQFPQHTAIDICDREADFYELFEAKKVPNVHLLVRSRSDKTLDNDQKLWNTLDQQEVEDFHLANIYDDGGKKREISFQIKFTNVTIPPTYRATRDQPQNSDPVPLTALLIEQVSPLQDWQEKPIKWRLLTTLPVDTIEQALQIVQFYIQRWRIEEFHYVLKQGAKIEQTQFKEPATVQNAIALYSLLSWKVMNLRYAATEYPQMNIEQLGFTSKHYLVLALFLNKNRKTTLNPKAPCPNVKHFVELLKLLATTSKSKRPPGVKAIWIGLAKLTLLIQAYEAFI
jgi:hypothetical protein